MLSCFPFIQSCFQCVYPQDNVNNILGQFYCSKGRFPVTDDGKKVRLTTSTDMYINASDPYMRKVLIILSQKLLEEEFDQSPTGITAQELLLRCAKYEQAKFSYWRSEERRRVL